MLVSAAPRSGADRVLDTVLFEVGGRAVSRCLVRAWAQAEHGGVAARFAARVAERARLGAGDPDDDEAVDALVEAEAAEFRYARELESSEDLVAWLEARDLTVEGWWESLRRTVLERRAADGREVAPPEAREDEPTDEEAVQRADLAVTDLLDGATQAFAARLAVALDTQRWVLPAELTDEAARTAAFSALEAIWTPWREAALGEVALQAAVDRDRLTWLVLEVEQTVWPSGDAAREAVSCVQYDGMALDELAAEAGTEAVRATLLLADVPEALHDALLVAAPGELVGPVAVGARWYVLRLHAKRPPTLADPAVHAAAERTVESRASAAAVSRHVVWRGFRP